MNYINKITIKNIKKYIKTCNWTIPPLILYNKIIIIKIMNLLCYSLDSHIIKLNLSIKREKKKCKQTITPHGTIRI